MALPPHRARIRRNPTRTEPNGFCVECGIRVSGKRYLRCRKCFNAWNNRRKAGTFTPTTAQRAVQRKTALGRALREEVAALRALATEHGLQLPAPHTARIARTEGNEHG